MHRSPRASISAALALVGFIAAAPAAAQTDPALNWNNYEKITLASGADTNGGPLSLAVMPSGKVLFTTRQGDLRLTDPKTGITKTANTFNVYGPNDGAPEEGLQTATLDPDFATNKWVYVYYSPQWKFDANGNPTNAIPAPMSGNDPAGRPYPTKKFATNSPSTMPATTVPFDSPSCYPLTDACQGAFPEYWQQWKGYNVLSRFKWDDAKEQLDFSSEQEIIRIDAQRGQCCHLGTSVDWDSKGNLYLSTGDNTPSGAFGSGGLGTMSDDTPGINPGVDSRRGSGNTNDLRGKILRIKVKDDMADGHDPGLGKSYTAPTGNLRDYVKTKWPSLVTSDFDAKFRPEIFVMGVRNPFRMFIDRKTDEIQWADYGPDNSTPTPLRGPMGVVEWQVTKVPMNGGWPYCLGPNTREDDPNLTSDGPFGFSHNDYNFYTSTQGDWYDCNTPGKLVNDSRWNTGLRVLPPATPATAFYGDRLTDQPRPEFINFRTPGKLFECPNGGPRYHYDASNPSTTKWPKYWDNKWFFDEFDNRYIAAMTTVDDANGVPQLTTMENVLPNLELDKQGVRRWQNVSDLEFGPDGSLYTIEYGDGGSTNTALVRTDWAPGNKTPQAKITGTPVSNSGAPLTVNFSSAGSKDPEGQTLTYEWDFDGDGTWDATGANASNTYAKNGAYVARLRVTDPSGKYSLATQKITVGNQAPTIITNAPADGGFFTWGDAVVFNVTATDPEDGTTPVATRMVRTWSMGHNAHVHTISSGTGLSGVINTVDDGSHPDTEKTFGVLQFDYTDAGANGIGAATTTKTITLQKRLQQAEFADEQNGVTIVDDNTASGAHYVSSFNAGDSLGFTPINFLNMTGVRTTARGDGVLSLRWGSATAAPFATVTVNSTDWSTVSTTFATVPAGTGTLYVTSNGGVQLDALNFVGDGVSDKTAPTATATIAPTTPSGLNGWYTGNVTLTVVGTDNGAIATRQYSTDGGTTWTATAANGTATINTQGTTNVLYRVTDTGGNVSAVGGPITFKRDSVAPVSTAALSPAAAGATGYYDGSPTITIAATDASSGVAKSEYNDNNGGWVPYTGPFTVGPGTHSIQYRSTDLAGLVEAAKLIGEFKVAAVEDGSVGGSVPATLSLTLGSPANFGPFTPGIAKDYTASTTANVISTAGDAALTVSEPGHLANGPFSLPEALQVAFSKAAWTAPASNDPVTITFKQHVGANDALRTGTYSTTLTFTLSTTTP
ncbi:MAG TPA: PQQ-dependent sugar dehydrogenase [Solirubrobacter sp.]